MKIISLNLHCLMESNQDIKLKRVAKFIKDNYIDVCLFQEVAQHKDMKIIYDNIKEGCNLEFILKELPDYSFYFQAKKLGFEVFEEGLAILTKNKMTNTGYVYLSKSTDYNNWLTRIALYSSYQGVTFYNIHLGWTCGDETYENQVDKLSLMALNQDNLVFILGDYNCCMYSDQYNYFKNKGFISIGEKFIDPVLNPTFNFELDNKQTLNRVIDHVFVNKDVIIKEYKVLFSDNPVSDHNMIYLEVDL